MAQRPPQASAGSPREQGRGESATLHVHDTLMHAAVPEPRDRDASIVIDLPIAASLGKLLLYNDQPQPTVTLNTTNDVGAPCVLDQDWTEEGQSSKCQSLEDLVTACAEWRTCRSPVVLRGLLIGTWHNVAAVRATDSDTDNLSTQTG
jgi:hypothetical protein